MYELRFNNIEFFSTSKWSVNIHIHLNYPQIDNQ